MDKDHIDITSDDVLANNFENLRPKMMSSRSHLLVDNDVPGSPLPLRHSKITSNSELDLGQVDSQEYVWEKKDHSEKNCKRSAIYKTIFLVGMLFLIVGLVFSSGLLVGYYAIGDGGQESNMADSTGQANKGPLGAFSVGGPTNACGDCSGCYWTAANACYESWEKETCERYKDSGYVWCSATQQEEEDAVVVPENPQDSDCEKEVELQVVTKVVVKTATVTTTLGLATTGTTVPLPTPSDSFIEEDNNINIPLPPPPPEDEEEEEEEEENNNDSSNPIEYDNNNGEITGFEKTVSPQNILKMFSDWGLTYPMGEQSGEQAAITLHKHIIQAINLKKDVFKGFCNSNDPDANKREAAAFFANIRKETGGFASLEERGTASGQYCSSSSLSGASEQLKVAGLDYPCADQKKYHGRGAIQLTWNFNYGRFSEFIYGDKNILLREPESVKPDGPLGWAATLWFWMTPQGYGGQCPPKQLDSFLETGTQSCHEAMQSGAGMGKTINIINGGYECCSTSPLRRSPIARLNSYLDFCGILGCERVNEGCAIGDYKNCDISQECPLVSVKKDKGCDAKNTCQSQKKSLWVGIDNFQIERWSCPDC